MMIAMSGGVDSSVAAMLMVEQGYHCAGLTLRLFDPVQIADHRLPCPESEESESARSVANKLGIPFFSLDLSQEFHAQVIAYFAQTYLQGATPNPCVVCNQKIKFGLLLEQAAQFGYENVVTGHYAVIERSATGRWLLKKAADHTKDQSYVLYSLSQHQLAHARFPLATLEKSLARELAAQGGFITAHKKDSQDICFVKDGNYRLFLEQWLQTKFLPGDFVNEHGDILGRHKGLVGYTIGQRKGLGISAPQPLFVLEKQVDTNRIVLGSDDSLFKKQVFADQTNWISVNGLTGPMKVKARIRYNQKEADAVVHPLDANRVCVEFAAAQRAPARGQSIVFYDGDYVVGGGIIQ